MPFLVELERDYGARPFLENPHPASLPAGKVLKEQPDDVLVSALVAAATAKEGSYTWSSVVEWLSRKRLPYTVDDVELLLSWALRPTRSDALEGLKPAVAAAEQLDPDERERLRPELEEALRAADAYDGYDAAGRTRVRTRLRQLLGGAGLDLSLFDDDNWGDRMRELAARLPASNELNELLLHLSRATSPRPSQRWRKEAIAKLRAPGGEQLVRTMLEQARDVDDRLLRTWQWEGEVFHDWLYLTDANATLVRGALWTLADLDRPWRLELLDELLARGVRENYKVSNACIYVLGEIGEPAALARLAELKARVTDKTITKQVERALEAAAQRAGLTKSELRESLVPDLGLNSRGRREAPIGRFVAVLSADPAGVAKLTWREAANKPLRTPPATVKEEHPDALRALKAELKKLKDALSVERGRLEDLLVEERQIPLALWRERYLGHGLTQSFARWLIWRLRTRAGELSVLPLGESAVDSAGTSVTLPEDGTAELWHPIAASVDEVAAWRSLLLEREILQPFKQAFREVYLLAPAEEQTGTYSNRFAAHIVNYPKTYALMKARRWSTVALGPFDNDGGRNWRDFESHGLRVEFLLDDAITDHGDYDVLARFASTDQVRFSRLADREQVPLRDVPPVVFSEAMRDVDLFVSVSSIAGDPYWQDRGDRRFDTYWHRVSFGELTETAETRREVLAELLPRLRISDRCELTEKFLLVRGDLRTYKIHLGSANVLMEPNDEYLCIVPARSGVPKRLFLPFEEDSRLALILSKAFLLADDTKIEDETIVRQIARA